MDEKDYLADLANAPRVPGIDAAYAVAGAILRELEARQPGFRDAVRARLHDKAARMAASDDADERADAPSMQDLAEEPLFTD